MSAHITSGFGHNRSWRRPMWNTAPIAVGSGVTATVRPPDQSNAPLVGDVTGLGIGGGVGIGGNADSSFGNVRFNVGLAPSASGSLTLTWPVAPPPQANGISFAADWATVTQAAPAGATLDFNFTSGTLDPSITWTRASAATDGLYTDQAGAPYNTLAANAPRIPMSGRGLLVENNVPTFTNLLFNSDAPATQTVTLASGVGATYTLSVIGTGSATITAGTGAATGLGTATPGVPLSNIIITTTGTFIVTVNGSLNRFQMERFLYATSYMPAVGAGVTRQADSGSLPVAAWFNNNEGTLLTDFVKTQNPNGVFNDMPSLWTDQNNLIGARFAGSPALGGLVWNANAITGATVAQTALIGTVNRHAISYSRITNLLGGALNGQAVAPGVVTGFPAIAQLKFGIGRGSALDGFVRRVRYWPRALGPIEMADMTNPAPLALVRTLNWTATRPLIPGELVRLAYQWNTST